MFSSLCMQDKLKLLVCRIIILIGLLSAPGTLAMDLMDNDSLRLNWTTPYTLPGTDISNFLISANMSGERISNTNSTESSYRFVFAEHNISRCQSHEIVFEVCGVNPVGIGDVATITVHVPRDSASQLCSVHGTQQPDQPTLDPLCMFCSI